MDCTVNIYYLILSGVVFIHSEALFPNIHTLLNMRAHGCQNPDQNICYKLYHVYVNNLYKKLSNHSISEL
jgi:hypothetical protein